MPTAPARPCRQYPCPELTRDRDGFCPTHKQERARAYDQARGSSTSRGYGAAHRRWRRQVLAAWPICATLYRPDGSPVWDATPEQLETPPPGHRRCWQPSTDADHLVTTRDRPDLRYDVSNGRGRCGSCHSRKTALEDGRWGA